MKHIFTIHSPITFLMAHAIVLHENINKKDVVLISASYKVQIDDYLVVSDFATVHKGIYNKIFKRNIPKHFDAYISRVTGGDEFIAYVDLMATFQKLLVTNEQCRQFHFFEEGNSAYQAFDDLTDITWPYRDLPYRLSGLHLPSILFAWYGINSRIMSIPYIYSAYTNMQGIKFYAFSNNAFYNAPPQKKVLLKLHKQEPVVQKLAGPYSLSNQLIWLDGSNARYTGLSEQYYYDAVKKSIPILRALGILQQKMYLKLRPGIKNFSENELYQLLKGLGFELEVLPDDMVLECFFIQSERCNVIGTLTAALEYAHVFGHQAYSIYGLFEKQPPTFFDRMDGFWKNVKKLA